MVSILTVHSSRRLVGRCDATCYNAQHPECHCICGGRNHGQGLSRAVKNQTAGVGLKPAFVEDFAAHRKLDPAELLVIDRARIRTRRQVRSALQARFTPKPREPDLIDRLSGDVRRASD